MIKKIKKLTILLFISVIMISNFENVNANFAIEKADLYSKGECVDLLQRKGAGKPIGVTKVYYKLNDNEIYPAYCLDRELEGVGEVGGYSVSIDDVYSNPLVWRVIINGYPYKSIQELKVNNEDEAYTATKQAIYCVLYDFDKNNYERYLTIGEGGVRTLNAMKTIVKSAREGTEVKPSSKITIKEKTSDWVIDSKEKNYVSKEFSVTAEAPIDYYKLSIDENVLEGIKITDLENNQKDKFNGKEDFKILIPLKELVLDGQFSIKVEGDVNTKPILYGKSGDSSRQNYAITGIKYEGGNGELKVNFTKNKSKIIIKKKDSENNNMLEGAEFNILDENGNIIYSNLKTDSKGIIVVDGILPGKYYLEETIAPNGYDKYEEKIEFEIQLDEELTIEVDNNKSKVEKKEKNIVKTEKKIKLPKTGM